MKRKDGYVVDTTYPVFFYKEMQPIWLNTVVQFLGFKTPSIRQKFSYLELACATGVNLLVAAMNHPHGSFIGVDFNPQHIELARKSAQKLGLKNIEFIHADFSEFLRSNTQQFDFIVNHGTFTWISSEQQQHILDIIDQSLKEFGICYLHYMCYPGSKDLIPLQKLFSLVDEHQPDLSVESIGIATQLFNDLNDAGAFVHQSKMEAVLNTLKNSSTYLAHEFLTDHWKPLFSADLHKMVYEKTKMTYLGSANPCENLDSISIPANLQSLIRDTQQPALKEYLKDIARDAKQRVDIFQKKPQPFNHVEHFKIINDTYFKLLPDFSRSKITWFNTSIGRIDANEHVLKALNQTMGHEHTSFKTLLNLPVFQQNPLFIIETLFLMIQEQYIHPVNDLASAVDIDQINQFNDLMKELGVSLNLMPDCATAIYKT